MSKHLTTILITRLHVLLHSDPTPILTSTLIVHAYLPSHVKHPFCSYI